VADSGRIEDLRRRVQRDPASIAFAQLAEECRRAGECQEAVGICRTGLATHPGYLSARVTLGRALIELNLLDEAQAELDQVLKGAPENLAALRGLGEIHHRRGNLSQALLHYRAALILARNDPDLQETVNDLSLEVEPPAPPPAADGLSLEQMTREMFVQHPPPLAQAEPAVREAVAPRPVAIPRLPVAAAPTPVAMPDAEPAVVSWPAVALVADVSAVATVSVVATVADVESAPPAAVAGHEPDAQPAATLDLLATRTIGALEEWLDAIHVARTHRGA
jgi:tetratricopeptide (TPR) repeat protein